MYFNDNLIIVLIFLFLYKNPLTLLDIPISNLGKRMEGVSKQLQQIKTKNILGKC